MLLQFKVELAEGLDSKVEGSDYRVAEGLGSRVVEDLDSRVVEGLDCRVVEDLGSRVVEGLDCRVAGLVLNRAPAVSVKLVEWEVEVLVSNRDLFLSRTGVHLIKLALSRCYYNSRHSKEGLVE